MTRLTFFYFILATILSGCTNDSVSFLDYYYPIDDFDEVKIYEYHAIDSKGNASPQANLFHVLYPQTDNKWSIVSLNSELKPADSVIIKLEHNELFIETMFFPIEGQYHPCAEKDQAFYPSELTPESETRKIFNYKGLNNPAFDQLRFAHISKLVGITSRQLTFKVESTYSELDENGNSIEEALSSTILHYEKGVGLIDFKSIVDEVETDYVLSKVWGFEEWKKRTAADKG